jgi:hypothetical protein
VIINGAGGIAVANIYVHNNFNLNLRVTVDSVPYMRHKSFPTYSQAFQWFTFFYPHINNKNDIEDMYANCCSNTSNINNPNPMLD